MNRFQVRRATLEDLPQLQALWQMENLPVEALEKRFTEFQVAQNEAGEVVAGIGLQIEEDQGCLHSEAIGWPDLADELRGWLWPRLEVVARHQGLARLWTHLEAPFWRSVGFKKASDELLASLPAGFTDSSAGWLHLPLRPAEMGQDEIEKHVAILKAMSHAENQQLMERARLLKWIAMTLITLVFGAFAIWVVYYARLRTRRRRQQTRDW